MLGLVVIIKITTNTETTQFIIRATEKHILLLLNSYFILNQIDVAIGETQ